MDDYLIDDLASNIENDLYTNRESNVSLLKELENKWEEIENNKNKNRSRSVSRKDSLREDSIKNLNFERNSEILEKKFFNKIQHKKPPLKINPSQTSLNSFYSPTATLEDLNNFFESKTKILDKYRKHKEPENREIISSYNHLIDDHEINHHERERIEGSRNNHSSMMSNKNKMPGSIIYNSNQSFSLNSNVEEIAGTITGLNRSKTQKNIVNPTTNLEPNKQVIKFSAPNGKLVNKFQNLFEIINGPVNKPNDNEIILTESYANDNFSLEGLRKNFDSIFLKVNPKTGETNRNNGIGNSFKKKYSRHDDLFKQENSSISSKFSSTKIFAINKIDSMINKIGSNAGSAKLNKFLNFPLY